MQSGVKIGEERGINEETKGEMGGEENKIVKEKEPRTRLWIK